MRSVSTHIMRTGEHAWGRVRERTWWRTRKHVGDHTGGRVWYRVWWDIGRRIRDLVQERDER